VRRVWQIEPSCVCFDNPQWNAFLGGLVDQVKQDFAVKEPVTATFYKLLVYEKGSFFSPHRDSEKENGMFATLIVSLPSQHVGGALVVQHGGETRRLLLDSPYEIQHAAFYADCQHEVEPLESGYRICLVYNLSAAGPRRPVAPTPAVGTQETASILSRALSKGGKLAVMLEHQYTQAGLTRATLKGWDRTCVAVLAEAAAVANCQLHLARLTWRQSGQSYDDDDCGDSADIDELEEESLELDHFVAMSGDQGGPSRMHLHLAELLSFTKPDMEKEVSPTGNEGTSVEKWYHGAVAVLWDRQHTLSLLASDGPHAAVPELQARIRKGDPTDTMLTFATQILDRWTQREELTDPPSGAMLECLAALADADLACRFVETVLPAASNGEEGTALAQLCSRLGWTRMASSLGGLVDNCRAGEGRDGRLEPMLQIFGTLCGLAAREAAGVAVLRDLVPSVLAMLASWDKTPPWQVDAERVGVIEGLFAALEHIDDADGMVRLVRHASRHPKWYDLHQVLAPAVRALTPPIARIRKGYAALHDHCVQDLRRRTAEPVMAPSHWTQDVKLRCACPECARVQTFLRDPRETDYRYTAAEAHRRHVTYELKELDVDCHTIRKGSPFTLHIKKNRASYERRKKQFATDLELLANLESLALAPA
jgi:hypothetical protein